MAVSGICRRPGCKVVLALPVEIEPVDVPQTVSGLPEVKLAARKHVDTAAALRILRCAADLSQKQVAAKAGVPRTYVSKIERGRAEPTIESIQKLCAGIGCSIMTFARFAELAVSC